MLTNEKKIIYWLAFIVASLVIVSAMGLVGMYGTLNIVSEKVMANERRLIEIIQYHNHDVDLLRENIRDMKTDQQIIKEDVKQILRKVEWKNNNQ